MTGRPSVERVLAALTSAALAPAAVAAALSITTGELQFAYSVFVGVFVVAMVHIAVLAMPLFLLMTRYSQATLGRVLVASFLIGAGPATLIASGDGAGTTVAVAALIFGGFGLCGGFAFWLALGAPEREPTP